MRELKFRAWEKDGRKMYYNVQLTYDDYDGMRDGERIENGELSFGSILESDTWEVMQFTGLHDKNGKEIYEGDILSLGYDQWTVEWNIDRCGFVIKARGDYRNIGWSFVDVVEVIGNVHENP